MKQTLEQQMNEAARRTPGHPDYISAADGDVFSVGFQSGNVLGSYLRAPSWEPSWEFQRPGLMESVLFVAIAFEVGALAAMLVNRLAGGV